MTKRNDAFVEFIGVCYGKVPSLYIENYEIRECAKPWGLIPASIWARALNLVRLVLRQTKPFGGYRSSRVKALKDWLKQSHIQSGSIFRAISKGGKVSDRAINPHSIAQLIKTFALAAGMDPANYSGIRCMLGWPPPPPRTASRFTRSKRKPGIVQM